MSNTFEKLLEDNRKGTLYFHILNADRKLCYGDGREVVPGKEMKAKRCGHDGFLPGNLPVLCQYGMHASLHVRDADRYVRIGIGKWVCLVRLNGEVDGLSNKFVGLRRKVVAMRQIKRGDMNKIIKAGEFYDKVDYNFYFIEWVLANPWVPGND